MLWVLQKTCYVLNLINSIHCLQQETQTGMDYLWQVGLFVNSPDLGQSYDVM